MITTDLFESRDICRVCGQTPCNCTHISEEKVRLDPKCWKGKKIGNPKTKLKGGVRVNNCVPAESVAEGEVRQFSKKHRGDLESIDACAKCGGDLQSGKYMGRAVKVCVPCKQVYLPPNSGIDQQGNEIKEGTGNIGSKIRALYQKIYDQGDDAVEFMYNDSPVFAQYWDEYEGDLDSIIAEVDPQELQVIFAELQSAAEDQGIAEDYDNGEYSDEAGMAHGNLITIAKAARGLLDTIDQHEDLPEWVQEKIAKVEGMLVSAWNYLQSQEAQGIDPRITEVYGTLAKAWSHVRNRMELVEEFDIIERVVEGLAVHNSVDEEVIWEDLESLTDDELYVFAVTTPIMEDWQKANKKDKTDGMSRKAVKAYRREHPGSKLQTAVTTKPSKLKKGSKASKRRKSYCSRSRGQMKMHNISCSKTPDKAICKARRRWNCESVDNTGTMVTEAGSPAQQAAIAIAMKKAHKKPKTNGVTEMDKSQPSHGRDGKISHSTYGSRDKKGSDYFTGKEAPGKPVDKKQVSKDALDILKKQGVAEGSLNEFAPSGDEGNSPYAYAIALKEMARLYAEGAFDYDVAPGSKAQNESDAEDISQVADAFMNQGMEAGREAYNMVDTGVRDEMDSYLKDQGFNVQNDIHAEYQKDVERYRNSPQGQAQARAQAAKDAEYAKGASARKANEVVISAVDAKTGEEEFSKISFDRGSVSPEQLRAKIQRSVAELKQHFVDYPGGNPSEKIIKVTIGGKPVDIDKGVNEVSDATLTSYLTKVHADSQKHDRDPSKRSPAKRNRSVQGFSRAFNKLDARREKTDEATLVDPNFAIAGDYKNYELQVRKTPFQNASTGEKFFIAQTTIGKNEYKVKGNTREEALQNLKNKIDEILNASTKVSAGATLDFNVKFVSDILSTPREQFFAKIVNVDGQPKLVIAGADMLSFGRELMQLGFKPSALRIDPESDRAMPLPSISYTKNQIANTGLIANGRYEIGNMTQDEDGNKVFDLKYHSTAHTKSDKMRLKVPAFTVGTVRDVDEDYAGISKQKLGDYLQAAHQDIIDRATGASFQSGRAGDVYNKADVSAKERQRKAGMSRALQRLTKEAEDDPFNIRPSLEKFAKTKPQARIAMGNKTIQDPGSAAPIKHDAAKLAQAWAQRYPNIDADIEAAKKKIDPNYEYAEGPAYRAGQEAENNLNRLLSIKKIIDAGVNEQSGLGFGESHNPIVLITKKLNS